MPNCVRVARQTLTLFVRVRILLRQPEKHRIAVLFYFAKILILTGNKYRDIIIIVFLYINITTEKGNGNGYGN